MTSYSFQVHQKGKPLHSSAKIIVMNVFVKLKEKHPEKTHTELVSIVSDLTGVSTTSIYRMQTEFRVSGSLSTHGMERPARKGKGTRLRKYEDYILSSIREKINNFYKRNEIPTSAKIAQEINDDDDLPNMSTRTVRRLMNDLGFVFRERNRTSTLIKQEDINEDELELVSYHQK